jgi:uncharacterized protein DUF5134
MVGALGVRWLLTAVFAIAAIPWFVRAIGPGRRVNDRAASHAAMSAGMAAMLLTML